MNRAVFRSRLTASGPGRIATASFVACLTLVLVLGGCGYRFMGTQLNYPAGVRSVEIGSFENRSREFGLDKILAFAFEREFHRRGLLRVEEQPGRADAILGGTIREFNTWPVAFDAQDDALQYEAELILDLDLRRRSDGQVLWQVAGLQRVTEYSVAARIMVPSSSQFQRGTIAVADLSRLTDIQLAQTEKRLSVERLINSVVRDVHDQIFDDF